MANTKHTHTNMYLTMTQQENYHLYNFISDQISTFDTGVTAFIEYLLLKLDMIYQVRGLRRFFQDFSFKFWEIKINEKGDFSDKDKSDRDDLILT